MRLKSLVMTHVPLLAVFVCFVAIAQDASQPAAEKPAEPDTIAVADIPARADLDSAFVQDVVTRAANEDPAAALQPELDLLAQSVLKQRTLYRRDTLRKLSVSRLESLDRQWRFAAKKLSIWRGRLDRAGAPYLEDADRLAKRRAEWKATLTAVEASGAPAALREQMAAVQSQLERAEQSISTPLDTLLALRQRAGRVAANIDAGMKETADSIAYIDSRLMVNESPPLWSIDDGSAGVDADSVVSDLQTEVEFLRDYTQTNKILVGIYTVIALGLLALFLWLSRRVGKLPTDDPKTSLSILVLRRPMSAWLLIAVGAVLLDKSDAPVLLLQASLLLMVMPLLRLLPPRAYQVLGFWPYVVSALFVLTLLGAALMSSAILRRYYLLGLTLVALTLMVVFLLYRRYAVAHGPEGPSWSIRLLRFAGWLSVAILVASTVANIVGNLSLAEMLTKALLTSTYVALAFYAGVHVLGSLTYLLLTRTALTRLQAVKNYGLAIERIAVRLFRVIALVGWLAIALTLFRVYRPTYQFIADALTYTVKFGKISATLGGVLTFILSVVAAMWIAKVVRFLLRDEVLPNMSLPRGVANSVATLSYYFLIIGGLTVALVASGFEIGQFAFALGALGVGIGLGLQDVVKNFVSGLILMFERPIQPGDVVEVGGIGGRVHSIGMRATTLATFEGAEVVVPNGALLAEKLTNWTLSNMNRRFEINFGVAYGTDVQRVLELAMKTIRATPGIATDPAPEVLFSGMGESSLNFILRAWTNNFSDWGQKRSELAMRIHDAIVASGIAIPFPPREMFVRTASSVTQARLDESAESSPRTT